MLKNFFCNTTNQVYLENFGLFDTSNEAARLKTTFQIWWWILESFFMLCSLFHNVWKSLKKSQFTKTHPIFLNKTTTDDNRRPFLNSLCLQCCKMRLFGWFSNTVLFRGKINLASRRVLEWGLSYSGLRNRTTLIKIRAFKKTSM